MDPALERSWDAQAWRCHPCATRERKGRSMAEDEASDTAGLYISIVKED